LNDVLGLKGDSFSVQGTYSVGAAGYATAGLANGLQVYSANQSAGFGWVNDGVYSTGTTIQLTTVWSLNGGYQHFWNPKWRSSLYGGYVEVDYSGQASTMICGSPALLGAAVGTPNFVPTNCSPNFSVEQVGTRTQWNPHPDLDIGIDLTWTHLNTAFAGTAVVGTSGARPPGTYTIEDQDVGSVAFRVQRNFLP
jgi:hypothetical protein